MFILHVEKKEELECESQRSSNKLQRFCVFSAANSSRVMVLLPISVVVVSCGMSKMT
jgi:hypothetical protein